METKVSSGDRWRTYLGVLLLNQLPRVVVFAIEKPPHVVARRTETVEPSLFDRFENIYPRQTPCSARALAQADISAPAPSNISILDKRPHCSLSNLRVERPALISNRKTQTAGQWRYWPRPCAAAFNA